MFGSILAVARGMIPEENRVFDPELLMTEVIQYTHYMPDEWKDQLHSKKVRHHLSTYIILVEVQGFSMIGSRRVWGIVCNESGDVCTGSSFGHLDAVCVVVFPSSMRSGDCGFL